MSTSTERVKRWREKNPERARETRLRYENKYKNQFGVSRSSHHYTTSRLSGDPSKVAKSLWRYTKNRAAEKGIPFDIDVEDVVIPEVCPVFGEPIVLSKKRDPMGPSIDRIVPELGYVKGNVAVISMKANRLKSNGLLGDFKKLIRYLESTVNSSIRV